MNPSKEDLIPIDKDDRIKMCNRKKQCAEAKVGTNGMWTITAVDQKIATGLCNLSIKSSLIAPEGRRWEARLALEKCINSLSPP